MAERKAVLVRLDPALHAALQRWAADELRSFNAQVEFVLQRALKENGRARRGGERSSRHDGVADQPDQE